MSIIGKDIVGEISYNFPDDTKFVKIETGLKIEKENGELTVRYARERDLARALLLVKAHADENSYSIEEKSDFEDVCFMADCSRNAVLNVETVKKLLRNLAMLGYNSCMLYTEDTYEVDGEPYFGYLRGRYTQEELKEIDAYAKELDMELIPCIQTLAHLNTIKRHKEYAPHFDCNDILLVGDDRVYQLIENMFKTLSKTFSSRRVHIGMDEAKFIGLGKYLDQNGYRNRFSILMEHLYKVCEIAQKYGFSPIMWSDMFWHIKYRETGKFEIPKEVIAQAPKEVSVCHWDYYNLDPAHYDHMFSIHEGFAQPLWFAGGSWKWLGMIPANGYSFKTTEVALEAAKRKGVKHLINTAWGDDGAEASVFSVLPSIAYFSLKARGVSEEEMRLEFKALTGYSFEDFLKIEGPNNCAGTAPNERANPTKYALFNDAFSGIFDSMLDQKEKKYFSIAAKDLKRLGGQYGYMFAAAASLSDVLSEKYDLGLQLRKAYQEKDTDTLLALAKRMEKILRKLRTYLEKFRAQWYTENKTYGFEIHEYRLGGLIERIKSCKKRLEAYCCGEITEIDELSETLLDNVFNRVWSDKRFAYNHFTLSASVNIF